MRKKLYKIAQMASLLLALVFTFSCWMDGNVGGGSCGWLDDCKKDPELEEWLKEQERLKREGEERALKFAPCVDGTVKIGDQVWQKCNLNIEPSEGKSYCYNNDNAYCQRFGRLYEWRAAMALPHDCASADCASQVAEKHRGLCPSGWHIPSTADWDKLVATVGGEKTAGKYLKASGWGGLDSYGFSALPGGINLPGARDDYFSGVGNYSHWWSSSSYRSCSACGLSDAYALSMTYSDENVYNSPGRKDTGFKSVRCLKD